MPNTSTDYSLEKVWAGWNYNPVILSYMDEAGGVSYERTDKSRFFVRSCVLVREQSLAAVQESVERVLNSFPTVGGFRLPFHASYIFHGNMRGARGWLAIPEAVRKAALYDMANVLEEHSLPCMYACVDKQKMVAKYGANSVNPHIMTFIQVGEIVELWMSKYPGTQNMHWLPCVGDNDYNRDIEKMFTQCRDFRPPYGYWSKQWTTAADVMAFTSPQRSKPFLLADLCAFAASRFEQQREDWDLFEKISPHIWSTKHYPK